MKKMDQSGFDVGSATPKVHCKAFKDNRGTLIMAKEHKVRPRTKHIAVKYHHFCHPVENGDIVVHLIDTKDQCADIFTKPLTDTDFVKHRQKIIECKGPTATRESECENISHKQTRYFKNRALIILPLAGHLARKSGRGLRNGMVGFTTW